MLIHFTSKKANYSARKSMALYPVPFLVPLPVSGPVSGIWFSICPQDGGRVREILSVNFDGVSLKWNLCLSCM